jgi:hypothetical protein
MKWMILALRLGQYVWTRGNEANIAPQKDAEFHDTIVEKNGKLL